MVVQGTWREVRMLDELVARAAHFQAHRRVCGAATQRCCTKDAGHERRRRPTEHPRFAASPALCALLVLCSRARQPTVRAAPDKYTPHVPSPELGRLFAQYAATEDVHGRARFAFANPRLWILRSVEVLVEEFGPDALAELGSLQVSAGLGRSTISTVEPALEAVRYSSVGGQDPVDGLAIGGWIDR